MALYEAVDICHNRIEGYCVAASHRSAVIRLGRRHNMRFIKVRKVEAKQITAPVNAEYKQSGHDYTVNLSTVTHTIEISPSTLYGWFENNKTGNSGGLWFERLPNGSLSLGDYDGVYMLALNVCRQLYRAGVDLSGIMLEPDELRQVQHGENLNWLRG